MSLLRDTGNGKLEIDSTSGRKQPMLTASTYTDF